jgi:glycerol-3-phosphate dehydrogenase (NAD(P)+)
MGGMYRRCRDQGGFMEGLLDKEGKSEAKYRRYNYGAALFRQATGELGQ